MKKLFVQHSSEYIEYSSIESPARGRRDIHYPDPDTFPPINNLWPQNG